MFRRCGVGHDVRSPRRMVLESGGDEQSVTSRATTSCDLKWKFDEHVEFAETFLNFCDWVLFRELAREFDPSRTLPIDPDLDWIGETAMTCDECGNCQGSRQRSRC